MDFTLRFLFIFILPYPLAKHHDVNRKTYKKYVMAQTVSSVPCAVEISHICAVSEYQKASSGSASASPRVHPVASANPGYPPHRCFRIHWLVLRTGSGCCCIGEEGWIPAPHPTNQDSRSTRPSPFFSYRHRYSESPIPSAFHESSPALRVYPDIDPVFTNTHNATSSSSRCVIGGMRPARSRSSARTDGFSVVLSRSGSSFPRSSIFNSASSSASLTLFSASSASWGTAFQARPAPLPAGS